MQSSVSCWKLTRTSTPASKAVARCPLQSLPRAVECMFTQLDVPLDSRALIRKRHLPQSSPLTGSPLPLCPFQFPSFHSHRHCLVQRLGWGQGGNAEASFRCGRCMGDEGRAGQDSSRGTPEYTVPKAHRKRRQGLFFLDFFTLRFVWLTHWQRPEDLKTPKGVLMFSGIQV